MDERDELKTLASQHRVDLFILGVDEIRGAIETGNSILYDALMFGTVLYDNLGIIDRLRGEVSQAIEDRRLRRSDSGWTVVGR